MESTATLIQSGLTITLIGMSVVFVLLTLLVGVVTLMSALCQRIVPELPPAASTADDDELISVISAAVSHYRRSRAAKLQSKNR